VAIRKGAMHRSPCCEDCGVFGRTVAHHDSYLRPLDVRFLCSPCHATRHRQLGWGYPRGPFGIEAWEGA
jgi:hypothetical protein